jgi:hypothetical protein
LAATTLADYDLSMVLHLTDTFVLGISDFIRSTAFSLSPKPHSSLRSQSG